MTTVEIKSGYGLDLDTEMRMLRVAKRLGEELPVTVFPTYLGAHALPPEFDNRHDDYIGFVCREVLPKVAAAELAAAVDVFCESIGFSYQQAEQVFQAARQHRLPVKIHAEQLSDLGGAGLAAKYDALSADHLEYLSKREPGPYPMPERWPYCCPVRFIICEKPDSRRLISCAATKFPSPLPPIAIRGPVRWVLFWRCSIWPVFSFA